MEADKKVFLFMADTLLFPEDIIYNILSRLPIKSLARFQCVCKLWLKYINDPYLRTIHVKEEEPAPLMFERVSFVDPNKIQISFLRGTTSLQQDPVLDLCFKSPYYGKPFLGSCNGLILVCYEQNPSAAGTFTYRLAVINPLSKRRHSLPPISIKIRSRGIDFYGPCNAAGIGFDDSTNTFKTVFSILKNPNRNRVCTMVHSSGTSSWRKIDQNLAHPISGEGVFSDGRLHWLTTHHELGDCDSLRKIVWFDVKTEEFGLPLDPPKGCHPEGCDCGFFNQLVGLNGEVGYAYIGMTCIKLWILKHEEWVLHCSIDLGLILPEYHDYDLEVSGCWNKDGDILLTENSGELLFVYTLKSGDLQEVELRDQCEGSTYIRMYQSSMFSVHTSAYYSS